MVNNFIHDNFLLENKFAETLYHDFAKDLPIIDYHNHLPPQEILEDTQYHNLTKVWINGDHYKWRAMRTLGIDEHYITGAGTDREKYDHWAKTVPYTLRNPLYHWTHLELARYFDIYSLLKPDSAASIYATTSEQLSSPEFSCRNLLRKVKAQVVCTTEDPLDDLRHHKQLAQSDFEIKVSTAFRPDKAILISSPTYNSYISALEQVADKEIRTYDDLKDALYHRIVYFHENGCRLSDHGLEKIPFTTFTDTEIGHIFSKRRDGQEITALEVLKFESALLLYLSETYHELGWVQQFHLGALRNNNARMHKILGPDTGWDSIGDFSQAQSLSLFLNTLDTQDKLTKTIVYNLNPADNEIMATMIGNYNDGSVRGKVQLGSAWWFLDQKDGMTKQINALSNMGLLSCFIGMLTDSRSFLSFPRHEYFRRLLCNLLGDEIQRGELPNDIPWIGKMVSDICYYNAKTYFNY